MKYIKQPKRHIALDDFEWKALVKGINEYRKQVNDEDRCVEVINELLLKSSTRRQGKSRLWRVQNEGRIYQQDWRLRSDALSVSKRN